MELQSLLPQNHLRDTAILAVSPDPVDKFRMMNTTLLERTGKEFAGTLLSDGAHRVIREYGLVNEMTAADGEYIPHPTCYVLDPSGKVRWKFTEKNFAVRPTNEMLLVELRKLWSGH